MGVFSVSKNGYSWRKYNRNEFSLSMNQDLTPSLKIKAVPGGIFDNCLLALNVTSLKHLSHIASLFSDRYNFFFKSCLTEVVAKELRHILLASAATLAPRQTTQPPQ